MKTLKLYLEQPGVIKPEIHRLITPEDTLNSYKSFCDKAVSLFPSLNGKKFVVYWIDEEGDDITVSSDEELIHAITSQPDLKKMSVRVISGNNNSSAENQYDQENFNAGDTHPNVICDACNGKVQGYRYKCLQCENYDLCSRCNNLDKHKGHDMLKMASPALYPHQWLFPGCARLWRSMFGHPCPRFGEGHKRCGRRNHGEEHWKKASERCKEKRGHGKGDKWSNAQFLKSVGQTVANLLDPFGVQVQVDVIPSDSEPETSDNEYKKQPEDDYVKKQNETTAKQEKSETEDKKGAETEKKLVGIVEPNENTSENTEPKVAACNSNHTDGGYASATGNIPSFQGVRPKDTLFPNAFSSQAQPVNGTDQKPTSDVIKDTPSKKSSPTEAESCVADDWTVLGSVNSENASKDKKPEKPTLKSEHAPLYPPVGDLNLKEAMTEMASYVHSALQRANLVSPTSSTQGGEEVVKPLDPKIENALSKMIAMGFTNEGGWLARLLETKSGNISEAIDALYPNPSGRH